ncbi:MAG TPA: Gfo/Idh/MocA family oxidoreductase, partial [Anaerolineales bacterium]|nr:Gfo/Idh/MocA family oxidoreductase [Anaerolineales bacterium]
RNRLTTVASRSTQAAQAYAKEWGIPRTHGSYEALLADPEVDVIYVPLPNALHAEWSIKALEAGKNVLCEKPMALSVQEADSMTAASRASGKALAEAFMYMHHPQTRRVKELVDSGKLGRLQLIRGAFTFTLKREGDVRLKTELGGGSIWDVGCYPISYARLLAGAEPQEVFGWQLPQGSGVDMSFVGQMRFPDGVLAQFDCGFQSPGRAFMEVVGSDGTMHIASPFKPGRDERVEIRLGDKTEKLIIRGQELYAGEVEDMADAVLNGEKPRVSLAQSRGNVAAIAALLESARTGKPVRI